MSIFSRRPFKIKLKSGRTGLIYIENGRELIIDSEMLAAPMSIAIFQDSNWKWNPPYENKIITDLERKKIFNNVVTYFKDKGWTVKTK